MPLIAAEIAVMAVGGGAGRLGLRIAALTTHKAVHASAGKAISSLPLPLLLLLLRLCLTRLLTAMRGK